MIKTKGLVIVTFQQVSEYIEVFPAMAANRDYSLRDENESQRNCHGLRDALSRLGLIRLSGLMTQLTRPGHVKVFMKTQCFLFHHVILLIRPIFHYLLIQQSPLKLS